MRKKCCVKDEQRRTSFKMKLIKMICSEHKLLIVATLVSIVVVFSLNLVGCRPTWFYTDELNMQHAVCTSSRIQCSCVTARIEYLMPPNTFFHAYFSGNYYEEGAPIDDAIARCSAQ